MCPSICAGLQYLLGGRDLSKDSNSYRLTDMSLLVNWLSPQVDRLLDSALHHMAKLEGASSGSHGWAVALFTEMSQIFPLADVPARSRFWFLIRQRHCLEFFIPGPL